MVSDRAKDGNRKFGPRAGGTQEISRWCNHRISTPNTNRALEGREKATRVWRPTSPWDHSHASRAPAGAHPVSGAVGGSFPVVPGRSATFTTG